jgi:hypothetical protein
MKHKYVYFSPWICFLFSFGSFSKDFMFQSWNLFDLHFNL